VSILLNPLHYFNFKNDVFQWIFVPKIKDENLSKRFSAAKEFGKIDPWEMLSFVQGLGIM
jgi:hypothetical protein